MEKDLCVYQRQFFDEITQKLDVKTSFPFLLSEILNISLDSAYRRLRGQTPLILPEIIKICEHFDATFSLGGSQTGNGHVKFFYKSLCGKKDPLEDLTVCLKDLNEKLRSVRKLPETTVYLTLTDLPIFYFANYPMLAKFRLKVWFNEMIGHNINDKINYQDQFSQLISILASIQDNLDGARRVEIWSDHTINNLIESILYYYQAGEFACKSEAITLLDQLCLLLEDMYKTIDSTEKEFDVYWSEVELSNSYLITEAMGSKFSMIKLFSINSIFTHEPIIYDDIKRWIDLRIQNSVLISRSNKKQRHLFFARMMDKVKQNRNQLESVATH